ncbi:MAG: class I SAM-dependent methyltransferase family protein [Candidatus Bathyarchaeia archaeon]
MRKTLRKQFAAQDSTGVYSSFDIVGDIAITKMPSHSSVSTGEVAEAIVKMHKNVKGIFLQETAVAGDFRLRSLRHIAGENRTLAVHKESGCQFKVDVEKCYFSPRLSGERLRIANLVQPEETVVNMFAGVGCFSILIAKQQPTAKVYSIDINPAAVKFMEENVRLNRVFGSVVPLLGDAGEIVQKQLQGCADRVLMPLPEKVFAYLPSAVSALKPSGGWIHVHIFERADKAQTAVRMVERRIAEALSSLNVSFQFDRIREVRSVGPRQFHIVVDIHLLPSSAL